MNPKTIRIDVWGLCPFRSPLFEPKERSVFAPGEPPPEPGQGLGPCLYQGCGLWKITKVVDGKPVDGLCGIRFLGEVMNSIAGSLEQLTRLQLKKSAEAGEEVIFSTGEKKPPEPS